MEENRPSLRLAKGSFARLRPASPEDPINVVSFVGDTEPPLDPMTGGGMQAVIVVGSSKASPILFWSDAAGRSQEAMTPSGPGVWISDLCPWARIICQTNGFAPAIQLQSLSSTRWSWLVSASGLSSSGEWYDGPLAIVSPNERVPAFVPAGGGAEVIVPWPCPVTDDTPTISELSQACEGKSLEAHLWRSYLAFFAAKHPSLVAAPECVLAAGPDVDLCSLVALVATVKLRTPCITFLRIAEGLPSSLRAALRKVSENLDLRLPPARCTSEAFPLTDLARGAPKTLVHGLVKAINFHSPVIPGHVMACVEKHTPVDD